jgi:hypothetical protein
MPLATDQQVQTFVNEHIRPRCEQIRALLLAINDDINAIGDVYAALTQPNPTWVDQRSDGVPHLMSSSDVLAVNIVLHNLQTAIQNDPQLPVVLQSCVRSVG